jgi:hypothetical protein
MTRTLKILNLKSVRKKDRFGKKKNHITPDSFHSRISHPFLAVAALRLDRSSFRFHTRLQPTVEAHDQRVHYRHRDGVPRLLHEQPQLFDVVRSIAVHPLAYDCPHVLNGA